MIYSKTLFIWFAKILVKEFFFIWWCVTRGDQGNFNGPDYIFKDLNNRLIKFTKNNIYNLSNFDERVKEFKEILINKNKKVDNYLKTEQIYLGIVVPNSLIDYEYYFLELILERYIKENNIKFDGVFIL